jgi:septal ring factor EnvC (AmiA/AmiB activator)
LSILEYKKQERAKEVTALEEQCFNLEQENSRFSELNENLHQQICDADEELRSVQESRDTAVAELADAEKEKATAQKKLSTLTSNMQKIEQFATEYTPCPVTGQLQK